MKSLTQAWWQAPVSTDLDLGGRWYLHYPLLQNLAGLHVAGDRCYQSTLGREGTYIQVKVTDRVLESVLLSFSRPRRYLAHLLQASLLPTGAINKDQLLRYSSWNIYSCSLVFSLRLLSGVGGS